MSHPLKKPLCIYDENSRVYSILDDSGSPERSWAYSKPEDIVVVSESDESVEECVDRVDRVDRVDNVPSCLLSQADIIEKADDPKGLNIPLMPHQQEALFWLSWREQQKPAGGVLADDMGLGKTLTLISLILSSKDKKSIEEDSDSENKNDGNWMSSYRETGVKGGTLVICPASLLSQWEGEIKNRCKRGVLSVKLYHGGNREKVPRHLGKYDVVITTYNIVAYEFKTLSTLYKVRWERVILDEAHIIRNHKTQVSQGVCALSANKRWALTGTPIHNKELDLYSILKFLKCSPFDDLRVWKRWMGDKTTKAGPNRLATVMKSLMLRRTKQELQQKGLLDALPSKFIEEVAVQLDEEEQLVYEKVLIFSRSLFAQFLHQRAIKDEVSDLNPDYYSTTKFVANSRPTQFTKAQDELLSLHADVKTHEILVLLLRLRQICCHPSLIHSMLDQEDIQETSTMNDGNVDSDLLSRINNISLLDSDVKSGTSETSGETTSEKEIGIDHRVRSNLLTSKNPVFDSNRPSSKMKAVLKTVDEILKNGDKLVIVSEWSKLLDIIASALHEKSGSTYAKLTGSVPVKDRQAIINHFNDEDDTLKILLLSLTAGGVGLNLVGANHLLLVDVHWNPQLESQAQDRIYRFGQKKDVYIYKFFCKDTIEEHVKQLQERKMELANIVLSGVKESVHKLTLTDIKSLLDL